MTKLDKIASNKTAYLRMVGVFVTLRTTCRKRVQKLSRLYKVIVVLNIYDKSLGIRLATHPANILILF